MTRTFAIVAVGIYFPLDEYAGRAKRLRAALEEARIDASPWTETRIALKNENDIVVTENGCELLTPLADDLWIAQA